MARPLILDDREALDKLAADLAGLYADAELRLQQALAVQIRAGLEADPLHVHRAIDLGRLRADAHQVVNYLNEVTPGEVQRILTIAAEHGTTSAVRELSGLARVRDFTVNQPPILANQSFINLVGDLTNGLEDVARRILRWPDDSYRRAVGLASSDLMLGLGQTNRSVQQRAWQALVNEGVTGFVDKAHRRWNLATYTEMATRTASRRAWDSQHEQTMLSNGIDLVSIVIGTDACKRCAEWAEKILRIDPGPIGDIEVERVDADGTIRVHVWGTVQQAREAGWQHPNCRCRQVAYLPGLSVVADATTYDPDAEADREKLRDLERQVRKLKITEVAAVSPEMEKEARRARLAKQAEIRQHVDETGQTRRRYREQIDLQRADYSGNSLPSAARGTAQIDAGWSPRPDGPSRVVIPENMKRPDPHEIETAQRLAAQGHEVVFVPPSNEPNVKTPDVLLDGRLWEMKSPEGGSEKNTIDKQISRAGKQADRLVLDTHRTPLDDDHIVANVQRKLGPSSRLSEVLVIRKDNTIVYFKRPST